MTSYLRLADDGRPPCRRCLSTRERVSESGTVAECQDCPDYGDEDSEPRLAPKGSVPCVKCQIRPVLIFAADGRMLCGTCAIEEVGAAAATVWVSA